MVDGTQDISGVEQESICFRHVDDNLHVHEDFVGLYELPITSGENAVSGCPAVREAIQWVHELGVLFKRSGKFKAIFKEIAHEGLSDDQPVKPSTIRPLCPTRWLCRLPAILSVKDNYLAVLDSLRDMASSGSSESAVKANGLLDRFEKGETYLSLEMVTKPIAAIEQLNRSCQARSAAVSGMLEAVKVTTKQVNSWRTDEEFHVLYRKAASKADELGLDPLRVPRKRTPPRCLTGPATPFNPTSAEQHYRQQYFSFIDAVVVQLNERYDPSKTDLAAYKMLEDMLLSGKVVDETFVQKYPELQKNILTVQLAMFKQTTGASSAHEGKVAYRGMKQEVRDLFPQVATLLKLLLVCPVSSIVKEKLENWMSAAFQLKGMKGIEKKQARALNPASVKRQSKIMETMTIG
ncbi:PREDICTED: uncharacterized protein LOC106812448 [Priapulus caudatus]|uniref:Uncharacterized protein LOC106812448 n=1 Tax=Priapulus caudatus TaxID=37621 RepID=A0ABM1EHZ8_PRICU|nr:PREDICTED: uncharacterized protein LOC106812448 [Priapulus caudatus]